MAWAGSTRRARLPADWPDIRRTVLERDGYRCRINGPRCTHTATQADHIERGDDHNPTNLQAACRPCHADKSSSEGVAARKRQTRTAEPHPGLLT